MAPIPPDKFIEELDYYIDLDRKGQYEFFFNGCRELLEKVRKHGLTTKGEIVENFLRDTLLNLRENPYMPPNMETFRNTLLRILAIDRPLLKKAKMASDAESLLRETIKLHGSELLNFAKNNYTKSGRGTVLFRFTLIDLEFKREDGIYFNKNEIIGKPEDIFGNVPDEIMRIMRSLIEGYDPNYEFICCITVSFPNKKNELRFAKWDIRNKLF
ncbi:hypothetical protein [Cylindrospermum sp. FACHB-282]|uniref:hypothetical protein n=1 Tax=Cylindrospermum sp. FACHB-282 TaxID=2692794 RepID=UPI0016861147|nr:hypothetical protein [Cylindrospermum sp. FACHB-282]MBD2385413.1 hypothetical protein [Cylindrospermum sp. FACHB-282]